MIASILWLQRVLDLMMNGILILNGCFQISEIFHSFQALRISLYFVLLSCIPISRPDRALSFFSIYIYTKLSLWKSGKYGKEHRNNPIRLLIFLKVSHCVSSSTWWRRRRVTQFSQTQIDIISLNHTFMYLGRYTVGLTRHDAGRRTFLTCYTSTDNGTGCMEIVHS